MSRVTVKVSRLCQKRVQFVWVVSYRPHARYVPDVLHPPDSLRRLGRVVPCVTALVQPGPSDYLIGTRLHVEGDGVPLIQLALLDPPLEEEVSFLVAEEERNEVSPHAGKRRRISYYSRT